MSKSGLGKGLTRLLDETKPVVKPAEQPAGDTTVASNINNAIETEKVKSNGLKVLLTSKQSTLSNVSNGGVFQKKHQQSVSEKDKPTYFPIWLLVLADLTLIGLAFIIVSKEVPSTAELLIAILAMSIGAALVCWGFLEKRKRS